MKNKLLILFITLTTLIISKSVFAQDDKALAQANNPLANMTALNFQNYYMPKINDAPADDYMNTTWIRFVKPWSDGKFLLRASAPLSTIGGPQTDGSVSTTSGLGDFNAFVSYNFISKPTSTIGIGPNITMPTASDNALGTGKWQAGLALVAFVVQSPQFQFGGLVTWQASVAGASDRSKTNSAAVQPFYFFQLGEGTYLRGAPIWIFNLENGDYSVPLGLGIGKVVKVGSTMFNLFIEPQYSMLSHGVQPQLQIFTGINLQFTN